MIAGQAGELLRRGGNDFSTGYSIGDHIGVYPVDLVAAGIGESCGDSKGVGFSISPCKHEFTANAIFELLLALDDQDACAAFGHVFGESCATHATAGDGQIIGC